MEWGGAKAVKKVTIEKQKDLTTTTGTTFGDVSINYTKYTVDNVPKKAFDTEFDKKDYEKVVIEFAEATTTAEWLLTDIEEPYAHGSSYQVIALGTLKCEANLTLSKNGHIVLGAGNPDVERSVVIACLYMYKTVGGLRVGEFIPVTKGVDATTETVAKTVNGGSASGAKAFDISSVDVTNGGAGDANRLIFSFSSPTVGKWVINCDGVETEIPANTLDYSLDITGKTTISSLSLSMGDGDFPRRNNFEKLTLVYDEEVEFTSIANASDWSTFAAAVNGGATDKCAVLTDDITITDGTMIGTESNKYAGTFDGAGHTLSFTYDGAGSKIAPFNFTNGATIVDLKTTGSITSTGNCLGGIIGDAYGENQLIRCASDMTMTSNDSGNGRVGGLVGRCTKAENSITFTNCLYNGAISSATADYACGFVGWSSDCTLKVSNCLVAPKSVTNGGKNFSDQAITIPAGKYAFYTTQFGSSTQGTKPTDAQLYNGYVAYTLNSDISDGVLFFGQGKLNSSVVELPSMTSDASKKVYKASNEALYANSDGLLPDPALSGKLAWKMAMIWDPIYFVTLPAASASNFNLYGSADSYILNVSSAGATTLVVPFDVEEANIPSGVKVYNLSFDGTDITATKVNSITANKPVLINAPEGEYRLESGIYYSEIINFSSYGNPTNGALTGVYNTSLPFSYVPKDAYVLQNGPEGLCFYQVDAENTIKITSFRAYLTADAGDARALSIKFPDDETAINKVQDSSIKVQDSEIYNLAGQRMSKPQKGVNIVNGKKVLVK
ncbi:MAG: hypothetical protein E7105_03990 [Prevotella sp.]|nr:hypothetical protein [Prevotella sp.]